MDPVLVTQIAGQAALTALCLLTAGLMLADCAVRSAWPVALPFLAFALATGAGLANAYGLYAGRGALAGAAYGLVLLIPPALHLAIRRLAEPARAPARADLAHALPPLAAGIALALAFHRHGLESPAADTLKRALWAAFAALAAAYLATAAWRIRFGYRRLRDHLSHRASPAERALGYALLLLALPLAALVLELLAARLVALDNRLRLALGLFRMGCVALLAVLALRPRGLFAAPGPEEEPPGPAYARSPLDEASLRRIAAKLEAAMESGRLYRAPFFALRDLAEAVQVSPHRISQVLNRYLGVNFFDYVNRWRIAEACERLTAEPDTPVLTIAEAVGFNSKSTFNAAFRKHTGTTPSAWRRAGPPAPAPQR
ncbi:MAG: helix-turn-helix domain-containing protein [Pseudomonadota bacterium]